MAISTGSGVSRKNIQSQLRSWANAAQSYSDADEQDKYNQGLMSPSEFRAYIKTRMNNLVPGTTAYLTWQKKDRSVELDEKELPIAQAVKNGTTDPSVYAQWLKDNRLTDLDPASPAYANIQNQILSLGNQQNTKTNEKNLAEEKVISDAVDAGTTSPAAYATWLTQNRLVNLTKGTPEYDAMQVKITNMNDKQVYADDKIAAATYNLSKQIDPRQADATYLQYMTDRVPKFTDPAGQQQANIELSGAQIQMTKNEKMYQMNDMYKEVAALGTDTVASATEKVKGLKNIQEWLITQGMMTEASNMDTSIMNANTALTVALDAQQSKNESAATAYTTSVNKGLADTKGAFDNFVQRVNLTEKPEVAAQLIQDAVNSGFSLPIPDPNDPNKSIVKEYPSMTSYVLDKEAALEASDGPDWMNTSPEGKQIMAEANGINFLSMPKEQQDQILSSEQLLELHTSQNKEDSAMIADKEGNLIYLPKTVTNAILLTRNMAKPLLDSDGQYTNEVMTQNDIRGREDVTDFGNSYIQGKPLKYVTDANGNEVAQKNKAGQTIYTFSLGNGKSNFVYSNDQKLPVAYDINSQSPTDVLAGFIKTQQEAKFDPWTADAARKVAEAWVETSVFSKNFWSHDNVYIKNGPEAVKEIYDFSKNNFNSLVNVLNPSNNVEQKQQVLDKIVETTKNAGQAIAQSEVGQAVKNFLTPGLENIATGAKYLENETQIAVQENPLVQKVKSLFDEKKVNDAKQAEADAAAAKAKAESEAMTKQQTIEAGAGLASTMAIPGAQQDAASNAGNMLATPPAPTVAPALTAAPAPVVTPEQIVKVNTALQKAPTPASTKAAGEPMVPATSPLTQDKFGQGTVMNSAANPVAFFQTQAELNRVPIAAGYYKVKQAGPTGGWDFFDSSAKPVNIDQVSKATGQGKASLVVGSSNPSDKLIK